MAKWKEMPDTPSPEAIARAALARAAEQIQSKVSDTNVSGLKEAALWIAIHGRDTVLALADDPAEVAAIIKKAQEDRG